MNSLIFDENWGFAVILLINTYSNRFQHIGLHCPSPGLDSISALDTWRREGKRFNVAFTRSFSDEIETRNREEIPFSSRIVPRGLLVAEGP